MTINIASLTDLSQPGDKPLAVLFLLHGRLGSAGQLESVVKGVLSLSESIGPRNRDLVAVTLVRAMFKSPSKAFRANSWDLTGPQKSWNTAY